MLEHPAEEEDDGLWGSTKPTLIHHPALLGLYHAFTHLSSKHWSPKSSAPACLPEFLASDICDQPSCSLWLLELYGVPIL